MDFYSTLNQQCIFTVLLASGPYAEPSVWCVMSFFFVESITPSVLVTSRIVNMYVTFRGEG